jgi:molecular chaperone DnaK
VFEIKRKMGTEYKVSIYGKEYTPQQISAFVLQKIKRDAETFMGGSVKKAVITVPAHFNDNQRQATKDAGEIAGLEVVRIINEPTAACLAFGLDKLEKEMKILVFSFGGGTHDVTLMDFGGGVFQVLATSGDTKTGGADIDNAVVGYLIDEFKRQSGIDLSTDRMAMTRLKEAAEKAKIELSTLVTTDVDLPFIMQDKHLHFTLTRAKLEDLALPIVERIRAPIKRVIEDAKLTLGDVNKIILIGGPLSASSSKTHWARLRREGLTPWNASPWVLRSRERSSRERSRIFSCLMLLPFHSALRRSGASSPE